jgi:glucosamine 6-phosphate synthetase-like amidotransferase/phosphosugar isomerase protein
MQKDFRAASPTVVAQTLNSYVRQRPQRRLAADSFDLSAIKKRIIVACGTSWPLVWLQCGFEQFARLPVVSMWQAEFYRDLF